MRTITTFLMALWLIPAYTWGGDKAMEILEKSREASGGSAWDEVASAHYRMILSTGGLEGTAEGWEDVKTGFNRSHFSLGPISGEEGFDGEVSWSKDTSGQVLLREGDNDREGAINGAYRASLSYWYPERWPARIEYAGEKREEEKSFDVVTITPEGGRPFDLWIDIKTRLIDRTVEQSAIETRTTFLSDYRGVSGVMYPFAIRSTNGETRYDMFMTVESVEFNVPLQEDLFAMPAPPPPDFVIAGGKSSSKIPFKLLNNHIYVDIKLNGRGPYRVICDTGGANIVTPTLAAELGLKPEGTLQGRGAGEASEDVGLVMIDSLTVGDITLANQLFMVFPLESFSNIEGVDQYGLIGYEVFRRFVVKVDYENEELTMTLPEAFSHDGNGTVVPFKFSGSMPQVEGSIDGIPGVFDIDTGARSSLTLMGPFVEKHDLVSKYSPEFESVTGWGVGGPVRTQVTRTRNLRLGDVDFREPVTEFSLQTGGAFTDTYVAGNVGTRLLKRYNIIFDYNRQEMILEPNANVSKPDVFDRSGMWINRSGGGFEVVDMIEIGPAAEAGLAVGDVIVRVDGKEVRDLSLPGLRRRFVTDPPGTRMNLTVKNEEGEREIILVLRDLV